MIEDEKWMKVAISEAKLAACENEIPVGAVIVRNNELIAKAHNQSIMSNDPTAHAEIQALRIAGKIINNYRITDSTLYVTLEPCVMCLGAIMHSRISKVIFGTTDPKTGFCGSCANLKDEKFFFHKLEIENGILEKECREILLSFFRSKR